MVRYTGLESAIGFYEETSYAPNSGTPIEYPDFTGGMESLDASKEMLYPEFLTAQGKRLGDINVLSESASGGVTLSPRWNGKSWWMFLSHVCGEYSTKGSGTGSAKTHTMQIGEAINQATAPETYSIGAIVDRGGTTGAVRYRGLKPISSELSFAYNQSVQMSTEFAGAGASPASALTFSETANNPLMVSPSTTSSVSFLRFGGTGYQTESASIKFERPRVAVKDITATEATAQQIDGMAIVTGSFETYSLDETSSAFDAFTTAYRAQTGSAIILQANGNDGTNVTNLTITIPKAVITSNPQAHVDGAGVQKVTVEWEACIDYGTTDYLANLVLENSNDLDKGFRA
tara:strand:- start:1542 stop:2579 length:1038 start_codon:yes stop_codon:yes gene_type:complete